MKKDTSQFIRDLHAELAPVGDEPAGEWKVVPSSCGLKPSEKQGIELLAASASMTPSTLMRVGIRRILREARDAGVLKPVKA